MVQGLALASLTFVVAAPSLAAVDPALEESAEVHGLKMWSRLTAVTLPLIAPALIAAGLLTFMVSLAVFDIPAVLGLSNKIVLYSTYVYNLVNPSGGMPLYEIAAASSTPMLLLAIGLSFLYYNFVRRSHRYQVVSGKAYRSKRTQLTRRAHILGWSFISLYFTLAIGLPLLTIVWVSFLPFFQPISVEAVKLVSLGNYSGVLTSAFWEAAINTATLTVVAPTITVAISLAISWVVTRHRGIVGRGFEILAFLPLSIPSVIFAVGAVAIALAMGSLLPIYGSIWLIILVEIVVRTSIATRITTTAMLQIHNELDEAGAVFGLSPLTRFNRIMIPLLTPAVVYCWFFLALLAFRELTVPALLVSRDNVTISVYTWGLLSGGSFGGAAALTTLVILSLFSVGLVAIALNRVIARRRAGEALIG
jgi:iron(III) transport system permease protein